MLQTMLIKIGLSIFKWLPLERIVAKVLTAAIERVMQSKKAAAQIAQIRKTGINRTRLEILNLWADGEPAKHFESRLPAGG